MNKQQLNNLVISYQETRDDLIFEEIYRIIDKLRNRLENISRYQFLDYWDVQAVFDDTLLNCINKYDRETDFENFFNKSFKNRISNLKRDLKIRNNYEVVINETIEGKEKENSFFEDLLINNEDYEFLPNTLEVENQLLLIDYLLDKIKDPLTTAIVKEVLDDEAGKLKPTAIGRKLGVHHMIVTRSLAKLKKYYDSNLFGDYRDYLCG